MMENWERWEPVSNLSPKYYIESISDSIEGVQVLLLDACGEGKRVEVIFEDSVHAYRSTDESYIPGTINSIDERYGIEFFTEWTFFKVTNSEYIQWLSDQSYGIVESESLIHFSFLAVDLILDVIAAYEPRVNRK